MNFLLLFSISLIAKVYAQQKPADITEITAHCSKLVKNLNVKGIDAYVPSESEAKENMAELGKILKISRIKDETERKTKFEEHPELKKLLEKLKKVKGLKLMSEGDQETMLKTNEDMLETVVRLSMLDTTNRKSPIYGKNVRKLLDDSLILAKKPASMKKKYHQKDGNVRLLFTKVIPPGRKMPDSNNIKYTDDEGRECVCSC